MHNEFIKKTYYGDKPSTNSQKRTCKLRSCKTRLTRYNLGDFCLAHSMKGAELFAKEQAEKIQRTAKALQLKRMADKMKKKMRKNK